MGKIFEKIIFTLKMSSIILVILILCVFIYSYLSSIFYEKSNFEILSENWHFSFYENDTESENIIISLPFDISGYIKYKKGKVVLSQKLDLSKYKNPAIRLGKLSDGIEIYIDDNLISEYGKKADIIFSAFNFDKTINLVNFNNEEKLHEIKIVIYILTNVSITQPFYLGEFEDLDFKSNLVNFFNVKIKRFLFLIILIISILFFYIAFKERRKDLFYFSISSFFVLLFSSNQLFEFLPINYIKFNYFLVYKSMYLMAIFFFLSFFNLINEKINTFVKIIITLFIISFLIDTFFYKNYEIRRKFYTYELFFGILSFLYLVLYVFRRYFYYKNKELKKFLLPFTVLFLSIINDMLVFLFPQSYPQFYTMIIGFELYIIIVSRIILNELIETYITTNKKNTELKETNNKLKNYLDEISSSIKLIKNNDILFDETSSSLKESSHFTKNQIVLLKEKTLELTDLNKKIHEIDNSIIEIAENQIKIGSLLRDLIELNSYNFNFMKDNVNITKEFSNQIEEIAKQTSLLALNASIESTRSIDYYKSFNVVSNEVKNLALKSTDLVSKIKNIADEIIISTGSGIESSKILSKYFENFYDNFHQFMDILNQNQNIHKSIELNFNEISESISNLVDIIDKLYIYSESLKNRM